MLSYLVSNLYVEPTPVVHVPPTPAELEILKGRIRTFVTNNGLKVKTDAIVKAIQTQYPGRMTDNEIEVVLQAVQDEYDALRAAANPPVEPPVVP